MRMIFSAREWLRAGDAKPLRLAVAVKPTEAAGIDWLFAIASAD